jgi:hypothetical protein
MINTLVSKSILAMLVLRKGDTLAHLLARLDLAVAKACINRVAQLSIRCQLRQRSGKGARPSSSLLLKLQPARNSRLV